MEPAGLWAKTRGPNSTPTARAAFSRPPVTVLPASEGIGSVADSTWSMTCWYGQVGGGHRGAAQVRVPAGVADGAAASGHGAQDVHPGGAEVDGGAAEVGER